MGNRWRLVLAAVAFLGWLGYLGYAALTKSRDPVVSHAQAAAATAAVVAKVEAGPDGKPAARVKVDARLWGDGPEGPVDVMNLSEAKGYVGPSDYLLYLTRTHDHEVWLLVGPQRSPGADLTGAGPPLVYPWTDHVRRQAEKLRP